MSPSLSRKLRVAVIVALCLAVVLMVGLAVSHGRVVGVGQTVQFDDFFFTVQDAHRLSSPGPGGHAEPPARVSYVVKLTIDNRAKRVPFRFFDRSLVLVDSADAGRVYHVDPESQRAHTESTGGQHANPLILKAGESATQDYVFSIAVNAVAPRLKFTTGGSIGEALEKLLGNYTEIQLP
jgi:hypothetical protein